jgi:hypothetical protein
MTRLTQAHTAQGGITLDLEQDELGSRFYCSWALATRMRGGVWLTGPGCAHHAFLSSLRL